MTETETARASVPPRLAYSVAEAAAALGISRYLVRQLLADGQLSKVRAGDRVLVSAVSLRDFASAPPAPARRARGGR
jgi:excisionase family DNA binding protein